MVGVFLFLFSNWYKNNFQKIEIETSLQINTFHNAEKKKEKKKKRCLGDQFYFKFFFLKKKYKKYHVEFVDCFFFFLDNDKGIELIYFFFLKKF